MSHVLTDPGDKPGDDRAFAGERDEPDEPGDAIPLARPAVADAEVAAVTAALLSGRLVLGPWVARLERALAECTGREHAICVGSGTTALELALWATVRAGGDAAGAGAGVVGEVIVPAASFPAAAHAALRIGAEPVPVDVAPDSWNLDPDRVADAITPRTRAIVAIDSFGLLADHARLQAAADRAGGPPIALIDDAACSLGARDAGGCPGGGYGVAGTLSFHPRKVITTGEGGALVCDDPALAERVRRLRNHGQAAPTQAAQAHAGQAASRVDGRADAGPRPVPARFVEPGTNARLGELAAALGCAQIERLDAFLAERRLLAAGYRERLAALRESGALTWQHVAGDDGTGPGDAADAGCAGHAYQTFAVRLAPGLDRDRAIARLRALGIEAGVATFAAHRLGSLRDVPAVQRAALMSGSRTPWPNADALHERGLALPLYVGMRSAQLDRVCDALAEVLA